MIRSYLSHHTRLGLVLAAVVFALDQASKYVLFEWVQLQPHDPMIITPFFNLVMVWNHGISFGMLSAARLPWALSIMALAIVAILLRWLYRSNDGYTASGLGLVIGGAMGNVVDRVRFGAVFDFLDVHLYGYHWPAFNIADSAICMGVVVLCIHSMMAPSPDSRGTS